MAKIKCNTPEADAILRNAEGIKGDLRMTGHTTITIHHTIRVDKCVADEIKTLNNKYNIVTEYCCCGHQGKYGYVTVKTDDSAIELMEYLGYKPLTLPREWAYTLSDKGIRRVVTSIRTVFQLKTRCKCEPYIQMDEKQRIAKAKAAYKLRQQRTK